MLPPPFYCLILASMDGESTRSAPSLYLSIVTDMDGEPTRSVNLRPPFTSQSSPASTESQQDPSSCTPSFTAQPSPMSIARRSFTRPRHRANPNILLLNHVRVNYSQKLAAGVMTQEGSGEGYSRITFQKNISYKSRHFGPPRSFP